MLTNMKQKLILILILILALGLPAGLAAQGKKPLTLEEVVGGAFYPENIYGVTPIPGDGEHYTQMNAAGTQVIKYSFRTGQQVEVLFDATQARECPFRQFDSYRFSPDGGTLLIATETTPIYRHSYTAVHYLYSLKRNAEGRIDNKVERLSDGGPQQVPVFSPDGTMIAFVRDNNIFLVKRLYGNSESQVTTDGQRNAVLNGIPDWVYEEEFAMDRALEFSADSKMLAYVRWDESAVPSYSFPLYAGEKPRREDYAKYPGAYTYKYPKTGEANSKVSVHTFDIKTKVTRTLKLPLEADAYIPRIRFTRDADKLAVFTLNRHQNRFDLYMADPHSTVCRLALREETDTYIKEGTFDNIRFYDGHFVFMSERSGFSHLYWYDLNGNLAKQITRGDFEVKNFLGLDEKTGTFYYTSNEGSPLRQAVWKTDRKGRKTRLTAEEGTHTAQFSTDMKYFLDRYTSLDTPTVITLRDNTGRTLTTLVDNAALNRKLAEYALPAIEKYQNADVGEVQIQV